MHRCRNAAGRRIGGLRLGVPLLTSVHARDELCNGWKGKFVEGG